MIGKIQAIHERNEPMIAGLLEVWQSSVVETHTFLSQADIMAIKPDAKMGFMAIQQLYGFFDRSDTLQGFIGVENEKIEMLFIDANARGQGIGKQLLSFALNQLNAKYVDVNEQNEQAIGFYRHLGFVQIGRSELDEQGRPFPILHLQIKDLEKRHSDH